MRTVHVDFLGLISHRSHIFWFLLYQSIWIKINLYQSISIYINLYHQSWLVVFLTTHLGVFLEWGSSSHRGFQYQVMVIHDLDDLGYLHDFGNLHLVVVVLFFFGFHSSHFYSLKKNNIVSMISNKRNLYIYSISLVLLVIWGFNPLNRPSRISQSHLPGLSGEAPVISSATICDGCDVITSRWSTFYSCANWKNHRWNMIGKSTINGYINYINYQWLHGYMANHHIFNRYSQRTD